MAIHQPFANAVREAKEAHLARHHTLQGFSLAVSVGAEGRWALGNGVKGQSTVTDSSLPGPGIHVLVPHSEKPGMLTWQ